MVSWWRAENDANDVFNLNHGSLQGGADFAAGEVGQAFSFDGTSSYVSVARAGGLNPGVNDFSYDGWVNFSTGSGKRTIYVQPVDGGEVLSAIVRSRHEWNTPLYQVMPFSKVVRAQGILL